MLKHRVKRLEARFMGRVNQRIPDVHFHDEGTDPRESCEKCEGMTDEEYQAWLADKSDGVKVIEVRCSRAEPPWH